MKQIAIRVSLALALSLGLFVLGPLSYVITGSPTVGAAGGGPLVNPLIDSVSGYTLVQSDSIIVHLEDHLPGQYDIYLEDEFGVKYLICANIQTNASNQTNPDPACSLPGAGVPDGTFTLYSTVSGLLSHVATDPQPVVVLPSPPPFIGIAGGSVWAANETTELTLYFHNVISGTTYDVKLYAPDGTTELQTIDTNHTGSSTLPIAWTVPDVSDCPAIGPDSCIIRSFENGTAITAEVMVKINQPQIVMSPPSDTDPANGIAYVRGEVVLIWLKAHTPGKRYDIILPNATFLSTADTNAVGDTTYALVWIIRQDCRFGGGLPNGSYTATSHPLGGTRTIASTNFDVFTGTSPDITVDGGATWVAGSTINIRVLQHLTETTHYLEFNGIRISTGAADDTFITTYCGDAVINYTIPLLVTTGTYTIASFDNTNNVQQATVNLMVQAGTPPSELIYLPVIMKQ